MEGVQYCLNQPCAKKVVFPLLRNTNTAKKKKIALLYSLACQGNGIYILNENGTQYSPCFSGHIKYLPSEMPGLVTLKVLL
ncbi:hypothetical protein BDE02_14G092100 [Populus trichocarpa]|nr:hypothetical protein BDE02_14G092100 [Populus trichocarpa]